VERRARPIRFQTTLMVTSMLPRRGFGIGTKLLGVLDELLRDVASEARQADIEAGTQGIIIAAREMQMDFGINGNFGHRHLRLRAASPDRAFEARRPAGRKELLRIGADTR